MIETSFVDRCVAKLIPLIRAGDLNGISMAEDAVLEMMLTTPDGSRQTGLLNSLDHALKRLRTLEGSQSRQFVDLVADFIDQKIRFLKDVA